MNLEQQIADSMQDQAEALAALATALSENKPNVVVNVPKADPPTINVTAPTTQVEPPNVTVNHKPCAWDIETTEWTDGRGSRWKVTPIP